jgi:Ser/Thr protein kinase RdoA (MazF antagonist)
MGAAGHPKAAMFPVTDSNLRPEALIEQVLPAYRLGAIDRCRLHARGINDTYRVETAGGETFYLRVYRHGWRGREEIDTELALLRHLGERGAPVSVPLARTDGATLNVLDCAEGQRFAAVFTAASGEDIDYKSYAEDGARAYAVAAAAVHAAAESFPGARSRPVLDLAELLERPLRRVLAAIDHRAEDVAFLVTLGATLRGRIERAGGLTHGFCHGDLHGGNAGTRDGVVTLYDFDCCGWGFRAYDLAVFPWAFALTESAPDRIETLGRAFLGEYLRHRPLGEADIAAIPAFVAIRQIWFVGLHVSLGDRFGWGWMNDRYLDRQLEVLRDWETNFLDRPARAWLSGPQ